MKNQLLTILYSFLTLLLFSCQNVPMTYESYDAYPVYEGKDLGLTYLPAHSTFKLWSPTASAVRLHFYAHGQGGAALKTVDLTRGDSGVWTTTLPHNLEGQFYTFQVQIENKWLEEVPDPYAKAVGVNGKRAQVVDLQKTNPDGWETDTRPTLKQFTDIILYELHFRDISTHSSSGIQHKGKFLGLAETNTTNSEGLSTGLDHLKDLGVTHLHLLPSYDYQSIDEAQPEREQYNWGYDPQNYNVPEGSYSTDAANGAVRIKEFKQLIQTLHKHGFRVVMDVVYNHTRETEKSNFNQLVPGYYYRQDSLGNWSNASACGNETASERAMMRKFIIESVTYWAQEYHIDGFRFDLMGIHDITTMNAVRAALDAIDPSIFVYGEGWTGGASPLPDEERALKHHTHRLNRIAAFSDDFRDGVKGHVFTADAQAFISGQAGLKESVKFGIVAATEHPQIDYQQVNYSKAPWAKEPYQCLNYVSCHDNHTLWDRLKNSCPEEPEEELIKMHQLAITMVLTSQGVPFLHAGVELLRTKNGVENSFESPDSINQINWSRKSQYPSVFAYYQALIQLRKKHPAFRMMSKELLQKHLEFIETEDDNLLAYQLKNHANGDAFETIVVIFNGNKDLRSVVIPTGEWTIIGQEGTLSEAGLGTFSGSTIPIAGRSALILKK